MFKYLFALAATEDEIVALRNALKEQWEYNHFEHCGRTWPHPQGQYCGWPLPVLLGGDPASHRPYAETPT